jgi:uncharacterized protein YceK
MKRVALFVLVSCGLALSGCAVYVPRHRVSVGYAYSSYSAPADDCEPPPRCDDEW